MPASTVTRDEVRAAIGAFQSNPLSADGQYRFVGGESGWELLPVVCGSVRVSAAWPMVNTHDFNRQSRMFNPSRSS